MARCRFSARRGFSVHDQSETRRGMPAKEQSAALTPMSVDCERRAKEIDAGAPAAPLAALLALEDELDDDDDDDGTLGAFAPSAATALASGGAEAAAAGEDAPAASPLQVEAHVHTSVMLLNSADIAENSEGVSIVAQLTSSSAAEAFAAPTASAAPTGTALGDAASSAAFSGEITAMTGPPWWCLAP